MEMSLLFSTAASTSMPDCFINGGLSRSHSLALTTNFNASRKARRKTVSLVSSFSRQTLSSNWDVCQNYSTTSVATATAAPWLPRFEGLDTANMLLRQRIIFLGSQLDDMTAEFIISQLLFLDPRDPKKDIKLFINSPGGSVTAGMGICDAMKLCKADVSTVCLGLAASMGVFILASGTKGKRFCMPNSRVMIHQPLGTAGGKATDMSIHIREMTYHKINKILSRITGKPEEQIEVDTDRDNFMNPWEAKEYGLIDSVIYDGKPGLVAPIADASPLPKTRVWDLWKVEGSWEAKKNLPSEHRFLQNGYNKGQGSDGDKGPGQEQETPAVV